jgi:hypothetical protein
VPGKYKYLKFVALCGKKSTHLLVTRRCFERSQGAQRGLLCVGEPPDARDSESFVGAIPPQGSQKLTSFEVPEHDRSIIAATGQPAAIGTHLERVHCFLMPLFRMHTLSPLDLPSAHLAVPASTDQHLPIGTPG